MLLLPCPDLPSYVSGWGWGRKAFPWRMTLEDKTWNTKITYWASRARVMGKDPSGAWTPGCKAVSFLQVTWRRMSAAYCLSLFLCGKVC